LFHTFGYPSGVRPFEEVYAEAVDAEGVSPEIVARLRGIYEGVVWGSGPSVVKPQLLALLRFLNSEEGRTDANCRAIDYFFCIGEWEWESLPQGYQTLFADMGGGLHEAVAAPEIAEALDATPESLLARAEALPPKSVR
jgi:hypothetical protein